MTLDQTCSNRFAPLNKMATRAKNRKITFKRLLLFNKWMDFEIIIPAFFLGGPVPKLLKPFRSVEQNGHKGYKKKKSFKQLLLLNRWTDFKIKFTEMCLG